MLKYSKSIIFILLAVIAGSVFYIFISGKGGLSVDLSFPEPILIGVPFDVRVELANKSGAVLKNVVLNLDLPDGSVFSGEEEKKFFEKKNFGDIGEGGITSETYKVVFLRGQGTVQTLRASVSYLPSNLGSRFETVKEAEAEIKESGVSVDLVGPESVLSGQEFELEAVYRNISEVGFTDLELKLEYPASFSFTGASVIPDRGNNVWVLGDLRKGSEGTFAVRGSAVGPENSALDFKTILAAAIGGRQYELETKPFSLKIAPSLLSLNATIGDSAEHIAKPGENLNYVVSYINNSDAILRGATIKVRLVGEMFDFNSLNTDGTFRASDNTLVWNSQNTPELGAINPKSSGSVRFGVRVKDQYPIRRFGDKNFALKVNAEIKADEIYNLIRLENKVAGNLSLGVQGYFRDADSGILNKGALPPRVGQPTNFTVHWILKNFASDVSGAEIRAALPSGVKFTGKAVSDLGPAPFYDDKSNQMVWQVDKLAANKGVIDDPVEAVFQVEAVPGVDLAGKYLPIIGESTLKANDDFTGLGIISAVAGLTSALPNDATVGAQGGVVQP